MVSCYGTGVRPRCPSRLGHRGLTPVPKIKSEGEIFHGRFDFEGKRIKNTGLIEYSGQISSKNPAQFKKYIGYIPQENPLFENLSVIDNLRFHYCGCMESLPPVMERFGLDKYTHYTVNKLSGGMKKRLSIACSLAGAPSILILDEPGASLDIVCKTDICDYLSNYGKNGGTVIITNHEECELALCSRMLFIENASIRELPPVTGTELMHLISKESLHA